MEHPLSQMEDGDVDYEALPNQPLHITATAGAAAGICEHLFMYPIDTVKTRMQSLCPCPEKKLGPVDGLMSLMRREGWWRPLRGISAVAMGAGPAHAVYFSVYEQVKHRLTDGKLGHNQTLCYGAAGVVATVFHDAVMNPAEVVKQRMQMWGSPYAGTLECVRCIWKAEGYRAFYRSYTTQLMMNVPFQSTHFMAYEFFQQLLNPQRKYDPRSHMVSGACAGAFAAAITTPLDVIKTVLNTQQSATVNLVEVHHQTVFNPKTFAPCPKGSAIAPPIPIESVRVTFPGFKSAASSVLRAEGVGGFFSGVSARVLAHAPATAVSWFVYESAKALLKIPSHTGS